MHTIAAALIWFAVFFLTFFDTGAIISQADTSEAVRAIPASIVKNADKKLPANRPQVDTSIRSFTEIPLMLGRPAPCLETYTLYIR